MKIYRFPEDNEFNLEHRDYGISIGGKYLESNKWLVFYDIVKFKFVCFIYANDMETAINLAKDNLKATLNYYIKNTHRTIKNFQFVIEDL